MTRHSKSFDEVKGLLGDIGITITQGLPKDRDFSLISNTSKGGIPLEDKVLKWKNSKEWGEIEHPELGMVMTYWKAGTPCYDTYTAPRVTEDGDIYCERFCQDEGVWRDTMWIGEYKGEEEISFGY